MASLAIALGELGGLAEARGLVVVQVFKWRKERLGMDHPRTYEAMDNSTIPCPVPSLDDAKELTIRTLELQKTCLVMDLPTHIGR
jgi:hypothetical protein